MFFKDEDKPCLRKDDYPSNEASITIDTNSPLAIRSDCIILFDGNSNAELYNSYLIKHEYIKSIVLVSNSMIEKKLELSLNEDGYHKRIEAIYDIIDGIFKYIKKLGKNSAVIPYAYLDTAGIKLDSTSMELIGELVEKHKLELHLCIGYKFKFAPDGRLNELKEIEGELKREGNLKKGLVNPIIKYLAEPKRLELKKKDIDRLRKENNNYISSSNLNKYIIGGPGVITKLTDSELRDFLRELAKEIEVRNSPVENILEISMNLIFLLAREDAYMNSNALDREYIIDSLIANDSYLNRISHLIFSPRVLSYIRNGSRGVKKANLYKLALYGHLNVSTLLELMTMYGYGFSPLYNLDRYMFYYIANLDSSYLDIIDFIEVCSYKGSYATWLKDGKKAIEELNLGDNDLLELQNNNNLVE